MHVRGKNLREFAYSVTEGCFIVSDESSVQSDLHAIMLSGLSGRPAQCMIDQNPTHFSKRSCRFRIQSVNAWKVPKVNPDHS